METPSKIPTGNEPTGSPAEISASEIATGNSREAIQQASTKCDETPAAQILREGDLVRIPSPESLSNIAKSYLSLTATSPSWQVTQQTSEQHEKISADAQQIFLYHANPGTNTRDLISKC